MLDTWLTAFTALDGSRLLKYKFRLQSNGESMLTVGLYYDVVPGRESDFEKFFEVVIDEIKKMNGFVSALLYKRVDKTGSYLIYSEWKDRDSFESFIKSREFSGAKSGGSHMLTGRPYHRIYNV